MARLEDVLPAYREGKAITRKGWKGKDGYANDERGWYYDLTREDVNADDWLILDDKVILTREQFERAWASSWEKALVIAPQFEHFPSRGTLLKAFDGIWEELQK